VDFYSQLGEYLHGGSSLNMLRAPYSVDADHSDKTKNALTGEEIAGQTAILLIAGQDTTVPESIERCRRLMVSYL
jgi:hypothetical protein